MKKKVFIGAALVVIGLVAALVINQSGALFSTMNYKGALSQNTPNYPINEQGQTYGEGPYPVGTTQVPDLISATGENGVNGYVKASDLNTNVSSPEEAYAYQKSMEELGYKSIPLYKSDGKTVIGEFRLYSSRRD
ncbi:MULTISPECIES: hypothetical protein [Brevibacillus]|uniref:hypothetical protein n=1 Tax=Brevibacillus TaxID=55080 RepID=UPI001C8DDAED|nr:MULTISPECIES: hypothetical protein [Brevibacillus]MBY0083613.1 hypothetical protein [Brevibacillus brevis]MCE0451959.1 hypothetical protein [Brevibacillus sp. AF8]UKK96351.1 hypothetical protein FO446_02360 [Brevibacillus brevis]